MKLRRCAALVVLTSFLVGCANVNTIKTTTKFEDDKVVAVTVEESLSDTGMYHKSASSSEIAQASLGEVKAVQISNQDLTGLDNGAQSIIRFNNAEKIAGIVIKDYSGEKPTEWTDVANNVADKTGMIVGGTVAAVGLRELGKTVRKSSENKEDVITINGDGNKIETEETRQTATVTAVGSESSSTLSDPNVINGKKKAVVDEEEEDTLASQTLSNGCPEGSPVLHEGVCYSSGTAKDRGYIEQ